MTVGQNSWVTILEANTFIQYLWDGLFWSSLSNSDKERLLITAFYWINNSGYSIPETATADKVKQAQMLLAIEVYNSYEDYKKRQTLYASGVRNFNYDGWSESLTKQELPINIQNLLTGFQTGGGGQIFSLERDY